MSKASKYLKKLVDAGTKLQTCQKKFCVKELEAANKTLASVQIGIIQLKKDLQAKIITPATFIQKIKAEKLKIMSAPSSVNVTRCQMENCNSQARNMLIQLLKTDNLPKSILKIGNSLLQKEVVDAEEYLKFINDLTNVAIKKDNKSK